MVRKRTDAETGEMTGIAEAMLDSGKMVACGWIAFRAEVVPDDASEDEVAEYRRAFYCGAWHLWSLMMSGLTDPARLKRIDDELRSFRTEIVRAAQH